MTKPICGIYKITNQINGKCYIGQSVNIAKRWTEHRCKATSKGSEGFESHFYRSIRKYGLENFSFEILEECLREELNKKEQFYIAKYHSDQQDYGYNLTPGGDSQGPTTRKLTDKQVEEIFSLLDDSDLSQTEIAEKYNVTQQLISAINQGKDYFRDDKNYPIRSASESMIISCQKRGINCKSKQERNLKLELITKTSVLNLKCQHCGKLFHGEKDRKFCSHDCAHAAQRIVLRPSREILKAEVRQESFLSLSRKYKVSDNAIRKWCKAYNLPSKSSIIKSYSDEEWNEI